MTFTKVSLDLGKTEQVTDTFSLSDGSVSLQLIEYWNVVCDTKTVRGNQVSAASDGTNSIPTIGALYNIGGTVYYCIQRIPSRTGPFTWTVQVTYGLNIKHNTSSGSRFNVSINIDGQKWTKETYEDKDGKPIYNSAGQYFSPSLTATNSDTVIQIAYDTTTTDINSLLDAVDKVNGGPVNINIQGFSLSAAPRTLKLDKAQASSTYDPSSSTTTWHISMTAVYRPDGYTDHLPDRGFCELKEDENGDLKLFTIKDNDGHPLNEVSYLDGNGKKLDISDATGDDRTSPNYLDFKVEKETDLNRFFSVLS